MIYQHEVQSADQAITKAIDAHIEADQRGDGDDIPASIPRLDASELPEGRS